MLTTILIVVCSVCVCRAHMCMLSPQQRGGLFFINRIASESCYVLTGPCGRTKPSSSRVSVLGGSNFTVIFQKNNDHYNRNSPGYFSVSIADDDKGPFTELSRLTDSKNNQLSLYLAPVTLPKVSKGVRPMVIQTRYVVNSGVNRDIYFQCGDILVRAAPDPLECNAVSN